MSRIAHASLGLVSLFALPWALAACGDSSPADGGPDGGMDASTDAGTDLGPTDAAVDSGLTTLPGLHNPVEVVRDTRGMVHIYAQDDHDAMFANGYLQAQDRFAQMELTRRSVTGRLAEVLGGVQPSTIDDDITARWAGYKRDGEAIYASLPTDSPSKLAVDAFSEGVSLYIHRLQAGTIRLPRSSGLDLLNFVVNDPSFDDWHPADTFAIGRYLSHALSYGADDEIEKTQIRDDIATAFPATSSDPRIAARAGLFHDLYAFEPAMHVYTRMGIPNDPTDTGSRAIRAPQTLSNLFHRFAPRDRPALDQASDFLHRVRALDRVIAPLDRGSNDWVVSGRKTASGASILSNDPHLSLDTPPLFWYVHLNTKRAGGDLNVEGLGLVGTPGVILGFNDDIAWGVTTANHDVTDVYEEHVTPGTGGAPDTVTFNSTEVPLTHVDDVIHVSGAADVNVSFEKVPHHGLLTISVSGGVIAPRTGTTAYSVRWTGDDPSNELGCFLGMNKATSIDDARTNGIHLFEVGAQNFVVIERASPRIYWSTHARIPVRPAGCLMYDPATGAGTSPMFVLPGDGSCEWDATPVDDRYVPHEDDPARGYIATANNDLCGVEDDGNPANDTVYVGWDYDDGWRIDRISSELDRLTTAGGVTPDQMQTLQNDSHSEMGALLTPALLTSLAHVHEEAMTPGTHPEIATYVAGLSAADRTTLEAMRARLAAWTSFQAVDGVEGTPSAADVTDSIATTIFNVSLVNLSKRLLGDEVAMAMHRPWGEPATRTVQWAVIDPMKLQTYDATLGDTVLWDDLTTPAVETRDEIVARSFLAANVDLTARLGADPAGWQWGKIHTLTLSAQIPPLSGSSPLQLPPAGDATYPNGYPRHGDLWGIDAANYDLWTSTGNYTYNSGPQQRLVVEMRSDGPHAWNALPGGEILDVHSPHYHDELELWRHNQAPPLYYTDADVNAHVESMWTLSPM